MKVKKNEKKKYDYSIYKPSPRSTLQKALGYIKKRTDEDSKPTIRAVSVHLQMTVTDAITVIHELANHGYVQIGKSRKINGLNRIGSNFLSITPDKDVTRFLKASENEDAQSSEESDWEEALSLAERWICCFSAWTRLWNRIMKTALFRATKYRSQKNG